MLPLSCPFSLPLSGLRQANMGHDGPRKPPGKRQENGSHCENFYAQAHSPPSNPCMFKSNVIALYEDLTEKLIVLCEVVGS